jgi:hypothetical protein
MWPLMAMYKIMVRNSEMPKDFAKSVIAYTMPIADSMVQFTDPGDNKENESNESGLQKGVHFPSLENEQDPQKWIGYPSRSQMMWEKE